MEQHRKNTNYWSNTNYFTGTVKSDLYPSLTLCQTSPGFYVSAVQVYKKTLWEKEKLLVTSNFSFSHSVFYPFGELSTIFIKFEIVVCKLFQFGRVQNLSFGEGLMTNLVQDKLNS